MGDVGVEEIIAEPDEQGYLAATFAFVHHLVRSYGWYLILGLIGSYYLLRNRWRAAAVVEKSPQEIESWKAKEEQRLKSIQRLQQKYEEEAAVKAEKQKLLNEEKQKARLEELEKLAKEMEKDGGHKLGDGGGGASTSKSLRPEYNPLMGGDGVDRVCFRRPGGGAGG